MPYRQVFILLQTDALTTSVLSVFADLQDANDECLQQARLAGVSLVNDSSTTGPDRAVITPVEPMRWDTAEGVSCWVEGFDVTPKKIVSPNRGGRVTSEG